MKKILVFLLLIAMLGMVACGKGNNEKDANMTPVGGVTTPTEEPTEAPTEDPHKGWVKVFGEIYVPEITFAEWEVQNQDNIRCVTVFIESRNTSAFHTYAQSLPGFGYEIEADTDYSYAGKDPEGREILLTDYENGFMQFDIYY